MAAALALNDTYPHGKGHEVPYDIAVTLSVNYPTGGETIDFTKLPLLKASRLPNQVLVMNNPAGYTTEWVAGTTLANGKLKIYTTANTELSAGAYPTELKSPEVIMLRAWFRKNL